MKSIILSLLVIASLTGCKNSMGEKVSIEGSKGIIYFKGDGVTEADAKKLGNYLKESVGYFDNTTVKSVQIQKGGDGTYELRFAASEEQLKAAPTAGDEFKKIGAAISIELFNNAPVNVVLTDSKDKALLTLPFDKDVAKQLQEALDKAKQDAAPQDTMSTMPVEDSATNNNQ